MTKALSLIESRGSFYNSPLKIARPFRGRRNFFQKKEEKFRINDKIRVPEVRLVDETGEMVGVVSREKALEMAQAKGTDLVEISPKAKPPVCKIIDYGKFQYEQQKKEKQQKKASKGHEMKGIRLTFRIGPGDMERQRSKAEEFLTEGHPLRIQMILRGREKAHKDLAFEKLKGFTNSLAEVGKIEQLPKFSGFQIVCIVKPVTGVKK